MEKIILSLLFILTIFSANQILAQDQDQDQGTDIGSYRKKSGSGCYGLLYGKPHFAV